MKRREFLGNLGALTAALSGLPTQANASNQQSLEARLEDSKAWDPNIVDFIRANRSYIEESSKRYDLPSIFVASVLYIEKTRNRNVVDNIALKIGRDPTIGDMQIRASIAAMLDGKDYKRLSDEEQQQYQRSLRETSTNIDYGAKYLRFLLNRDNRVPSISANELLRNPKAMAIAATEYNIGPRGTSMENAEPSIYGFDVLAGLTPSSPLYKIFRVKINSEEDPVGDYLIENADKIRNSYQISLQETAKRKGKERGLYILGATAVLSLGAFLHSLYERRRNINSQLRKHY